MNTSYGFISTYPPTQCGLATFTSALRGALVVGESDDGPVLALVEGPPARLGPEVVAQLRMGDRSGGALAGLARLDDCDVVIVQHEYGIYGGRDGEDVLLLLEGLRAPSIVVLHTVLLHPTTHQREILEAVIARAGAVVTMTATARDRLATGYDVDLRKVHVIAHGAPSAPAVIPTAAVFRSGRATVLTWGLLGPGKGIEWAIEAMAELRDLDAQYVVAGQTHPKVILREGEAYRTALQARARTLGLAASVTFDGRYRAPDALASLVQSADVVLLPYDSVDQVTSGVLIEAVAAGKPVIATRFPHAVELLGNSAGILVEHRNPREIAAALRTLITHRDVAARMARAAAAEAPRLMWPAVAERYRELANSLIGVPA